MKPHSRKCARFRDSKQEAQRIELEDVPQAGKQSSHNSPADDNDAQPGRGTKSHQHKLHQLEEMYHPYMKFGARFGQNEKRSNSYCIDACVIACSITLF